MRTNSIHVLVLAMLVAAVAAAPAAAGGYQSADSVLAAGLAGSAGGDSSSEAGSRLPTPDTHLAQSGHPHPGLGELTAASGSTVSPADGFRWGDAGLGAGVTLALVVLGSAGLVIRRRMASAAATG